MGLRVGLASGLYVDLAFVRPCLDLPSHTTAYTCPPPRFFTPFADLEGGSPHGWDRSVISESLGCRDVHARFSRDLVSCFTISTPLALGSSQV